MVSISGLSDHLGAENVFHRGNCQMCGEATCVLPERYRACLQKVRFWRQHLNNTKIIKLTRVLGTKDSFSQQSASTDKGWAIGSAYDRSATLKSCPREGPLQGSCTETELFLKEKWKLPYEWWEETKQKNIIAKGGGKEWAIIVNAYQQRTLVLAFGRTKGHCKESQKSDGFQNTL